VLSVLCETTIHPLTPLVSELLIISFLDFCGLFVQMVVPSFLGPIFQRLYFSVDRVVLSVVFADICSAHLRKLLLVLISCDPLESGHFSLLGAKLLGKFEL
jgi:hypothetical protein